MSNNLRPCPHCGQDIDEKNNYYIFEGSRFVCWECGLFGPSANNREDALTAWNTREIEDSLYAELSEAKEHIKILETSRQWLAMECSVLSGQLNEYDHALKHYSVQHYLEWSEGEMDGQAK